MLPVPAQAVLDALSVSVAITGPVDQDTPILYINPAFTELTGYRPDEVQGRNPRVLQPSPLPASQSAARRRLAEVITKGQGGAGRILNRRKDNSEYWAEIRVAPLHDDGGTCVGFVAAQIDVTHRVDADKRLVRDLHAALHQQLHVLHQVLWARAPIAAKRCERLGRLSAAAAPCWPDTDPRILTLAAYLSLVGFIIDDDTVLELHEQDEPLSAMQQATLNAYPERGAALLDELPEMKPIAEAVRWHRTDFEPAEPSPGTPTGDRIPKPARVLHILHELDGHVRRFRSPAEALALIGQQPGRVDPELLNDLNRFLPQLIKNGWPGRWEASPMRIRSLRPGMVFDQDLRDHQGRLLASRGQQVTDRVLQTLHNMAERKLVAEPVQILRKCA